MSKTIEPCEICNGTGEVHTEARQEAGGIVDEVWSECECVSQASKYREEPEESGDN